MYKYEIKIDKAVSAKQATETTQPDLAGGKNTATAEQEPKPLMADDLFALFTANIIKEERLFVR